MPGSAGECSALESGYALRADCGGFCGDPVGPCPWFVAPCLPAGLRPGLQHHVELVLGYPADVAVPGFSQHGAQL